MELKVKYKITPRNIIDFVNIRRLAMRRNEWIFRRYRKVARSAVSFITSLFGCLSVCLSAPVPTCSGFTAAGWMILKLLLWGILSFFDRASLYMRVLKPIWCTIYLQIMAATVPSHVSDLLVADHQKVTMYICNNWNVLYVVVYCWNQPS
jgi:hypothetical protein